MEPVAHVFIFILRRMIFILHQTKFVSKKYFNPGSSMYLVIVPIVANTFLPPPLKRESNVTTTNAAPEFTFYSLYHLHLQVRVLSMATTQVSSTSHLDVAEADRGCICSITFGLQATSFSSSPRLNMFGRR